MKRWCAILACLACACGGAEAPTPFEPAYDAGDELGAASDAGDGEACVPITSDASPVEFNCGYTRKPAP